MIHRSTHTLRKYEPVTILRTVQQLFSAFPLRQMPCSRSAEQSLQNPENPEAAACFEDVLLTITERSLMVVMMIEEDRRLQAAVRYVLHSASCSSAWKAVCSHGMDL